MDNILNGIINWCTSNKETFELLMVVVSLVFSKAVVAISRVHKLVIDNAQTVADLPDEAKLQLATDDVITLFGKKLGWLLAIPGVESLIKWFVQVIYDNIKK